MPGVKIAVLVPCYNEGRSIAKVVRDFHTYLPKAQVYVYDNNSTDDTKAQAARAGAIVREERHQGKGNVVRRMFADVDADVYVLVDGDDTYTVERCQEAIDLLVDKQLDMVNIGRVTDSAAAFRRGHRAGNRWLSWIVQFVFNSELRDMLSGYRVLSRRFVKSFPSLAEGFEIEAELTIHAFELKMPVAELFAPYRERGEGSSSKLRTYRDGSRIAWMIVKLIKEERPMLFFGVAAILCMLLSVALAIPLVVTFAETGLVPRFPTAILATGLMLAGFLSLTCGLVLDTVTRGRRELKRLHYLSLPAIAEHA
ncbi:MAG TPA: glycosyltransferase family 2 protein [Chloroflexota bacterium]|nr:glycosyltransferase family 2 protein [Chloroflexota bacterium]